MSNKSFWSTPFSYAQYTLILITLWFIGFLLEVVTGGINKIFLKYPVNLGVILFFHVVLIVFFFKAKKCSLLFYKKEFVITFLTGFITLAITAGVIPQDKIFEQVWMNRLGLGRIVSSWPYLFTFILVESSLFLTVLKRLSRFSFKEVVFILNHLGLWIILIAATFGSFDRVSLKMNAREGRANWEAYQENSKPFNLPFAIYLEDFSMEEYPPEIALLSREGKFLKKKKTKGVAGESLKINQFNIILNEVNKDSVYLNNEWKIVKHPGSVWHAKIKITDKKNKTEVMSGDIASGSFMQTPKILGLKDQYIIRYLDPRPKKFSSNVKVFNPQGFIKEAFIEVNKPLKFDRYMIYQYSYDEKLGPWSEISIFELVYDPWIKVVYVGIFMLMLGSVGMIVLPKKLGGIS